MEFEAVLHNAIGEFGKYQIINLLLLALPAAVSGFMAGDYIFTAARLPYRCAIPECDGFQPEYAPEWIYNAVPATGTGFDDCNRFRNVTDLVQDDGNCPAYLFDTTTRVPCERYVYERQNSVVYDFSLECNEWLRALAGTLNSAGAMVALPLAGFISDYLGRRVSIVVFCFNMALVGVLRAFSVNYGMYAALQFASTALGGGSFSATYILATEIVGPKFRVITSATVSSTFALGQVILGIIASLVYEWRDLTLVLFTPVFLLVSYLWIVTESHRWLLSKGKEEEARATLQKAARLNGKTISDKTMDYLLTAIPNKLKLANEASKDDSTSNLFFRVLKSPVLLRRCCTTPVLWITTTFIYYGLSINSVGLSGNMYLNYIATAAIEIPGFWTAVLALNKIGRRTTLFAGYVLCGLCCIGFAFTPSSMVGLSQFLFLAGKYFTGLVMTSLYLYTAELYPTRHRHSFLGYSSMLGRIGSVIAPLTPPLMDYWSGIPSVMFGGMAIISGLLVLTQPETSGLKVPDTFEDAEMLGKS